MSENDPRHSTLRSGQLANLAGVSADTLRYYERCGLLPRARRSASGYRQFGHEALLRVRLIRSALSIGFTVEELGRILKARDSGAAPCCQVRDLAQQKLTMLEQRIRELTAMRDQLQATLDNWNDVLRKTKNGQKAGLLESFAISHPESGGTPSPLQSPPLRQKFSKLRRDFQQ